MHFLNDNPMIRAWTAGVPVEPQAADQLARTATLPILAGPIAVMPDVHLGIGATVGSVIPTRNAIIPAAVGVDIGCGMAAVRTTLRAADLPDNLHGLRTRIEAAVPHGVTRGGSDRGSWQTPGNQIMRRWLKPADGPDSSLAARWATLCEQHPAVAGRSVEQLGTLGGGNHFIEVCLDTTDTVWVMLHSGSRGLGNRVGVYFINAARELALTLDRQLPDRDLAWLDEGTPLFHAYVEAVGFAQDFARANRDVMLAAVLDTMRALLPPFTVEAQAVNCHHNYVQQEQHDGDTVWVTRKGAVRAGAGELGIIPGSMGARSFIVRGKGCAESYQSCSHGAGRVMSRMAARKHFTVADHEAATRGVECRKDEGVVDETPGAYKDIDAVMAAQADLVEIVHTLKQVLCVKG